MLSVLYGSGRMQAGGPGARRTHLDTAFGLFFFVFSTRHESPAEEDEGRIGHLATKKVFDTTSRERQSVMILPQVHLRKPCYDFYFL